MHELPIKFNLPDGFLEEELRSGFEVSVKQKKIWAIELDLLSKLQEVCQKHGITFHVCSGTLLGAVRHKGFIPWDDDLDVAMPRSEYERLLNLPDSEFGYPYFLQTARSDRKYHVPYARLRNCLTTGVVSATASPDYNNGIYIDIFVLDGYSDSLLVHRVQDAILRIAKKACNMYHDEHGINGSVKERLCRLFRPILTKCFSYDQVVWFYEYVQSYFTAKKEKIGWRNDFVKKAYSKFWVLKSDFENTIQLPYENITVPAPAAYDAILTRLYGNYMEFPPVEQRGKWHEGRIHFEPDIPYKEYFRRKNMKVEKLKG